MIVARVTREAKVAASRFGEGFRIGTVHHMAGGRGRGDEGAAGLTGGGPSQLGVGGSMRARDVSRPDDADITAAEKLVQVSYRPRSKARPPATGQPGSGGSSPVSS
jgi:hypothetical protein